MSDQQLEQETLALGDAIIRLVREASTFDVAMNGILLAYNQWCHSHGVPTNKSACAAMIYQALNAGFSKPIAQGFIEFLGVMVKNYNDPGADKILTDFYRLAEQDQAEAEAATVARSRERRTGARHNRFSRRLR